MSDTDIPQLSTPKKDDAPVWAPAFLAALRECGNVTVACGMAKIDRTTPYKHREADAEFASAWDAALLDAADLLEAAARKRATEGVRRKKFTRTGDPIMDEETGKQYEEYEYSDTLLIFLLKGALPEKYRERQEVKHTGKIDFSTWTDDEIQRFIAES